MTPAVIARAAVVPLFTEPTLRAEQASQMVLGETAAVLEVSAEWRRVRTDIDRYVGWVHAGYCAEVDLEAAEAWQRDAGGGRRIDQPAERRPDLGHDPEPFGAGRHRHRAARTAGRPVRASNRSTNSASGSALKAPRSIPVAPMARSIAAGSPSTSSSGSMRG